MENFHHDLETIKSDNRSGSQIILNHTVEAIMALLKRQDLSEHEIRNFLVKELQDVLRMHFPNMALRHFINELFLVIESPSGWESLQTSLGNFMDAYFQKWRDVNNKIASNAFHHLKFKGKTIFLHSNSGTIISLFSQLSYHGIEAQVIQTECRPQQEGRSQAKALADLGFPVKLIVDAAAPKYVQNSDIILVGSDAIMMDHFINKVGSLGISLSGEKYGIPYFVLADSRKIVNDPAFPKWVEEPKPYQEIWENPGNKNINPENYYFESVPNELVTGFITEESRFIGEEIDKFVKPLQRSKGLVEVF